MRQGKKFVDSFQKDQNKFHLEHEPIDFQLTVHISNLIETYGEEKITQYLKLVFGLTKQKRKVA